MLFPSYSSKKFIPMAQNNGFRSQRLILSIVMFVALFAFGVKSTLSLSPM